MSVNIGLHHRGMFKHATMPALPRKAQNRPSGGGDPVAGCITATVLGIAMWALIGAAAYLI